ncbi:conserved hypothetical protein [Cenarchaeum symbiosum A]|uniref:30S ribosomal protein S25e n=1 Tax=Cenarchaeum symbiosum (strain A) TaxID=414004 RepID=A0RU80_CENSY|nr:conserved hypothetical protein [Cenarchaeum symbiosum A]
MQVNRALFYLCMRAGTAGKVPVSTAALYSPVYPGLNPASFVYKGTEPTHPMGGSKNKSPAQREKAQGRSPDPKKGKKGDKGDGSVPKAAIRVTLTDEQASKILKESKVITIQHLGTSAGVKASASKAYLRDAERRGLVKAVGGRRGHILYQLA